METFQSQEQKLIVSIDVGFKHLSMCAMMLYQGIDKCSIFEWGILTLAGEKEKIPNIEELSIRLYKKLDDFTACLRKKGCMIIDHIIINNQPARLHGAMKHIQMLIYGYYQMNKYFDNRVKNVLLYTPVERLKVHTKTIQVPDVIGKKNKKTHIICNQKKAFAYVFEYVSQCPTLQYILMTHRCKEDMSESMLQGIAWARKNGYMIEWCYKKEDETPVQVNIVSDEMMMA